MSVKGFSFDGGATVEKYDYTALDNKPTIPAIDSTLSVADSAAESKSVGNALHVQSYKSIKQGNLERGGYASATGKVSNSKRLRLIDTFYVTKGTRLDFSVGSLYIMLWELSSDSLSGGNVIRSVSWTNTVNVYHAKNDCYIMIAFANGATDSESTTITLSDFLDAYYVKIGEASINEFSTIEIPSVKMLTKDIFEDGGFTSAEGYSENAKRIRIKLPFYVKKNTIIHFNVGSLYNSVWELSSQSLDGGNVIQNRTWSETDFYHVRNDCYIMIALANGETSGTSTAIHTSDYLDTYHIDVEAPYTDLGIETTINSRSIEEGGFTGDGGKNNSSTRLRITNPIYAKQGTLIKFSLGNLVHHVWELSTPSTTGGNVIANRTWSSETEYRVHNDCYIMLAFANADTSTNIYIHAFEESYTVTIEPCGDTQYLCQKSITKHMLYTDGFKTDGGKYNALNRLRIETPIYVKRGTQLTFSTGSLQQMVWELSSPETDGSNVLSAYGWGTFTDYIVRRNCYVMIAFANTDTSANIALTDFLDEYSVKITEHSVAEYSDFLQDDDTAVNTIVSDFNNLLRSTGTELDAFMFFTDSHYMGGSTGTVNFEQAILKMGGVYRRTATDFCLFGGDVIRNSTYTPTEAMEFLIKHDSMCRSMFGYKQYYPLVGNHEYNYISWEDALTENDILNAFFREEGKAYYEIKANHSTIYCLNTGLNRDQTHGYDVPMDAYKWEQIDWLANKLLTDDVPNAIIAMHTILNNNTGNPEFCLFINANELCSAYNNRTSITLNAVTYNFSNCVGKVKLFIGGHLHTDRNFIKNNIPCVLRRNASSDISPTFDLVMCNWYSNMVYFKRVGFGSDLTIDLSTNTFS